MVNSGSCSLADEYDCSLNITNCCQEPMPLIFMCQYIKILSECGILEWSLIWFGKLSLGAQISSCLGSCASGKHSKISMK